MVLQQKSVIHFNLLVADYNRAISHPTVVVFGCSARSRPTGCCGITGRLALQEMRSLSGGQKSRVVLAELMTHRPHLLLLDEVGGCCSMCFSVCTSCFYFLRLVGTVRQREKERERERKGEREKETERQTERGRQRKRERASSSP